MPAERGLQESPRTLSPSPASSPSVFTSWVCVTFLPTRLDRIHALPPPDLIPLVRRITRLQLRLWQANPIVFFPEHENAERWWRLIANCDKRRRRRLSGLDRLRDRCNIYMALSRICLPDTIVVAAPLVRKRDWITTLTCYRELRFRVIRYVSRDESDVPST